MSNVKNKVNNMHDYLKLSEVTEKKFPDGAYLTGGQMELLHGTMGIVTEAGELMDALKKEFIYGKDLDVTNIKEELGDVIWYWALVCRKCEVDPYEILQMNIDKLNLRYGDKFTEARALNRDLESERELLEASDSGCDTEEHF